MPKQVLRIRISARNDLNRLGLPFNSLVSGLLCHALRGTLRAGGSSPVRLFAPWRIQICVSRFILLRGFLSIGDFIGEFCRRSFCLLRLRLLCGCFIAGGFTGRRLIITGRIILIPGSRLVITSRIILIPGIIVSIPGIILCITGFCIAITGRIILITGRIIRIAGIIIRVLIFRGETSVVINSRRVFLLIGRFGGLLLQNRLLSPGL